MAPALIFALYFFSRLANLQALPIFNDEAFFIWVGRQVASNPTQNLFLNFTDGKEPLFFWLFALPQALPLDGLLAGRLFSVVLGAAALFFLYRLGGFWAALVFVLSPFLLLTQQLAVQENLLILLLVLALYFQKKWWFGIFAALAMFTKTTAVLYLLPLVNRKNLLAALLATLLYLPIVATSVFTHNAAYAGLGADFWTNLKQAGRWLVEYQGWPFVLLAFFAPMILRSPKGWLWWILGFGPIVAEALVAKIFFPRYFVFSIVPLALLAGTVIKKYRLALLVLLPNLLLSWQIVSDVRNAPVPTIERWQYIESWPAGYGIKEAAQFLKQQQAQKVIVEDIMVTKYGLPYYYPQAEYKINGVGDWYVFARQQDPPIDPALVLKFSYSKPAGREKITVYQKI
ncbi:hypothetical protein HY440_02915 [Candidatus Microgenomates bacterium]|nr:hypothetical protein [Candidatus Microgenomates bacterium]